MRKNTYFWHRSWDRKRSALFDSYQRHPTPTNMAALTSALFLMIPVSFHEHIEHQTYRTSISNKRVMIYTICHNLSINVGIPNIWKARKLKMVHLRIHLIEKENHLNQTIIFRFYVKFSGVYFICSPPNLAGCPSAVQANGKVLGLFKACSITLVDDPASTLGQHAPEKIN